MKEGKKRLCKRRKKKYIKHGDKAKIYKKLKK